MVAAVASARPAEVGRLFYLVMFLLMVAIFVAGFSTTVPADFTSNPGLPLLLHVHGAVFTLWVAIMVAQPSLIVAGNIRRHMQLGALGVLLAVPMVVMAVAATLFSIQAGRVPPFFPEPVFLVLNLVQIAAFAGLFTAAIALRRQSEWHKRLMFCACATILGPGLGRLLALADLGPATAPVLFALNDLVLLAGPVADLIVRRRVHPAYLWGVGVVLLTEVVIGPLAASPMVVQAVQALTR